MNRILLLIGVVLSIARPAEGGELRLWPAAHPTHAVASAQTPSPKGPHVRPLQSFADALGVRLGGASDQAVFDAAEAAMKATPGGLYVKVPPGRYRLHRIRFGSNSGYYSEAPQTVVLEQMRSSTSSEDTVFVALNDPYATNWLFWGFTLDGGWQYGRRPYADHPEQDPWLDHQHALSLTNTLSGVNDRKYRENSPIGAQNPRGRYGELLIANFGGDGLRAAGAGAQTVSAIQIFNVGGRGVAWTTYDNNASLIDIGGTGREGFYCGPNCGNNRLDTVKIWYSGIRRIAGASAGLLIDRGASNRLVGLQIQDTAGDGVVLDGGYDNSLDLGVQWQGEIAWMDAPVAALTLKGALFNRVTMNVSIPRYAAQRYPAVTRLLDDQIGPDKTASITNIIDILSDLPPEVAIVSHPLALSNRLTVNGSIR